MTALAHRSLEDFAVGTATDTGERTVTEADIAEFAELTGDFYPLHTDEEFARRSQFGERVAHGPLVYAISIGLMPLEFFGDSIAAFLGVESLRHLQPVFVGDSLRVRAEVIHTKRTSDGSKGVVGIEYRTFNQDDVQVLDMTAVFLIRQHEPPADQRVG